ncbi:NAD(P)-dependent alcohol dehydrogenase [Methylocaldum sp. BRCS4]|jgi:NADPH:quinone reductase-like Zn-dependent oxidoreductase|uniref:zinc-dependent alcohol dehydrogenase family protein n=1 Tax=Methylocaldum sp. 14B TaxID=1912213 RepID=UPI000989F61D|nr:NAD(P)-dependent alcohol dehydrogenase [Methylocaldum sp. 14B]MVF23707.1 NAD(P)-dependent alcohol dehydrogenase [Methylocaldum sp. BRCS4]
MRTYRFPKLRDVDDLTMTEEPPAKPGPRQVVVRLCAASLNYRDHLIMSGRYRGRIAPNLIPLSDGAGEVVEVGTEVTRCKVGDRVAGLFFQTWLGGELVPSDHARALGGPVDGVLTEYKLFDENGLVHLPEHLSFEEGATLPCAALTAWNALFTQRPLRAGETVLTLGTGGVSSFAVQFAHAAGARVIVTSSGDEKLEKARMFGASDLINYRTHPDWESEVLKLTEGRGVDHVVEVGGAGTLQRSIAAVRLGGAVHLIGVLTGGQIDPTPILFKSATVRGVYVGSREMFEAMNRLIAFHRIRPVIDKVFPFEAAKEAYRHLEGASHVGKIVIAIA